MPLVGAPAPSTPTRRSNRALERTITGEKEDLPQKRVAKALDIPDLGKGRRTPQEVDPKRRLTKAAPSVEEPAAKSRRTTQVATKDQQRLKLEEAELILQLGQHGVHEAGRDRLLPILQLVGPSRLPQVLGLWTFLGDGLSKPPATAALQVWGPAGSGKTKVVSDFLRVTGMRHVRLNCALFTSMGELLARLAEELRRCAAAAAADVGDAARKLQKRLPPGRLVRALDRLEVALKAPLEYLASEEEKQSEAGESKKSKVVVLLDHAQELQRLGVAATELLLELPEVLRHASQLSFVFVSRLPLSSQGVPTAREPPSVAFQAYEPSEVERVLTDALMSRVAVNNAVSSTSPAAPSPGDVRALCSSGLMTFARPYVGNNLQDLLRIGEEVLRSEEAVGLAAASTAALGKQIEKLVQQRLGLCDLTGLLERGHKANSESAAVSVAMRGLVMSEKRILLSLYLAARIDKDNDIQLFMPGGRGRGCRKPLRHQKEDAGPYSLWEPRPVPLARLLAVYHRLAKQDHLLGPALLEQLISLREAGFLSLLGEKGAVADRDPKVLCKVELPIASACARDLGIQIKEYLGEL